MSNGHGTLKQMRFFSLKWKLSLSFMVMALGFVSIYVALAKRTFEFDKISYIFETQHRQVTALAQNFDAQTERMLFDARSILGGLDTGTNRLSGGAEKIFWDHPNILALRLTQPTDKSLSMQIEKTPGLLKTMDAIARPETDSVHVTPVDQDRYVLTVTQAVHRLGPVRLQILYELRESLGQQVKGQVITMIHDKRLVKRTPGSSLQDSSIASALQSLPPSEATVERNVDGETYLISVAKSSAGGLLFASLSRRDAALGALHVLFKRSMIFLLFSFFATIIISLLLSNRLTQNIHQLTKTAERIGHGDFTTPAIVKSRDEVGILAQAFKKMSAEIQRLLAETVDKTRMEEELKTARFVQESLFPVHASYHNGHVRLCGLNKTTTECSGDWWFYYQQGSELFVLVADATGHGIPAALITAAARSVFSVVREAATDLKEVMSQWDRATQECSNGKVFMTAFLMRINVEHGEAVYINAGHEPPVLLSKNDSGKFKASYVIGEQSHSLGERKELWLENKITFQPGDRLVIYTDGLLAVKSPEGKGYSERRFLTYLEKALSPAMSPSDFVSTVDTHFTDLNAGQPLPDDITMLILDYRAKLT